MSNNDGLKAMGKFDKMICTLLPTTSNLPLVTHNL